MVKPTTFEMKKILEVQKLEAQLFNMIAQLHEETDYNKRVTLNLRLDVLANQYSKICI